MPVAWSNILANKKFGTVVTESMGGYVWYQNSRLNRITPWNNDPVRDVQSEVIYFSDVDSREIWTCSLGPMCDDNEYIIRYGMGFSKYEHCSNNIDQEVTVFVPENDSAKVYIINLKNLLTQKRKIKLTYYVRVALDEDEIKSNGFIRLDFDKNNNCIVAKNLINNEFNTHMYISSSEKINSYTINSAEFFGEGDLSNPDGVKIDKFSGDSSIKGDSIIALNIEFNIEALENKNISLIIGAEHNDIDCKNNSYKYSKIENCERELEGVKKYWESLTGKVIISTPIDSINITSNSWIIYQTLTSRIYAKTGYYQSGGAIGFRDQLQDVMSLKYFDSNIAKNQIICQSRHQFIEGDVLHWWHEENGRGIRSRFSDDYLWLPFVVCDYIEYTQDYDLLDVVTNYLGGNVLPENVNERYDRYFESDVKEDIYCHCKRAIQRAFNFGEQGLPKIGTGDWNDGFSNVGDKGKGESVWLGFFLYDVLAKFINLCEYRNDVDTKVEFENVMDKLKKVLNDNCWDGKWYRRAFCDDGQCLGSIHNKECRIDSISQSWAVISGAGSYDKKVMAMESLENHLIDKNAGIIKLLDPPFKDGSINPGYIKAYLPGTRENGGQYTHAAVWAIIAEAILGEGDKAVEFYKMISPIEHSKTKELANKYKIEPYVISADIYGYGNLTGQGGWSWYTGSASWYYVCILKYILGLRIQNGMLSICPAIPKYWNGYSIMYKYEDSIYNIRVSNPQGRCNGVEKFIFNGEEIVDKKIKIINNGLVNEIEIIM